MDSTRLDGPVEECSKVIIRYVDQADYSGLCLLFKPVLFEHFESSVAEIELVIKLDELQYDISLPNDIAETEKEQVEMEVKQFNSSIHQRLLDSIYLGAFENVLDQYVSSLITEYESESKEMEVVENVSILKKLIPIYNRISVLLDFSIYLASFNSTYKKLFHKLVLNLLDILLDISGNQLDIFWNYMESRLVLLGKHVFEKSVTGDRIALLEICNPLTDRYYKRGKINDTYKKDTFHDALQSRIRLFANNLLAVDDNTGLNKYFNVAGRSLPEMGVPKRKTNFIRDLMTCLKVVRDPYSYMKPSKLKDFRDASSACRRVFDELILKELKTTKKSSKDLYLIKPELSESEKEYLRQKYKETEYFPEVYWLSVFNKDSQTLDKEFKSDEDHYLDLLDDGKLRLIILLQIILISSFFSEMNSQYKRTFLQRLPPKTKHIVDDTVNDQVSTAFYRIKKAAISELMTIDPSLSFLLQHVIALERYWWKWLVYNKDPETQKPLLSNKILTEDKLVEVDNKFKGLFPIKEKKYFNIYVTPQLSRKMKGKRGMDNIEIRAWNPEDEMDYEESDPDLQNVRVWKQFRRKRQHHWMEFGETLTEEVVNKNQKTGQGEDGMEEDKMEEDKMDEDGAEQEQEQQQKQEQEETESQQLEIEKPESEQTESQQLESEQNQSEQPETNEIAPESNMTPESPSEQAQESQD